jgi:LPXTG cell wall anchor motif
MPPEEKPKPPAILPQLPIGTFTEVTPLLCFMGPLLVGAGLFLSLSQPARDTILTDLLTGENGSKIALAGTGLAVTGAVAVFKPKKD